MSVEGLSVYLNEITVMAIIMTRNQGMIAAPGRFTMSFVLDVDRVAKAVPAVSASRNSTEDESTAKTDERPE